MNELRELTIDELEEVSGGMSCSAAKSVALVYESLGDTLAILGNRDGAMYMYGKGAGVTAGGCG
jgi:bacteriocin-like protein